jgi:hypothetical protein
VREVITLGHVTPIPTSPPAIAGVVNVAGAVVPVIELSALVPRETADDIVQPRRGDGAVLVEVDGVTAAVRMHNVETVTTLNESAAAGRLFDGRGGEVPLLDMPALIKHAHARVVEQPADVAAGAARDP